MNSNAMIDQIVLVLESARKRKDMYFARMDAELAVAWLAGLRTGLSVAGLEWCTDVRRPVVERRGLEYRLAAWETEALRQSGLDEEAVIDELLAIEAEMWRVQRSCCLGNRCRVPFLA